MSFNRFVGCILRGLAANKPAAATTFTDYIYVETDAGNIWQCNGSVWTIINGPLKSEELFNKTIDTNTNNFVGIIQDPFTSQQRQGYLIPSLNVTDSLKFAIKGMPTNGTYSYVDDDLGTDGKISRFTTSIIENIGYFSNSTTQIISRVAYNTALKVRSKVSTTTGDRLYIGFSTNNTLPSSDTPLGSAESGIIVGFNTSATNYSIYRNDGTAAAPAAVTFATTKNTAWHNIEIIMQNSPLQITVILDDTLTQTFTTRIPALNTNLFMNVMLQSSVAAAKNFDISKIRFTSNLV